ncbi:penicillin-binding protein 1A [Thiomicrospira sp. R3]|uniref:penicillin-binding protein 1A n=1 Tax=Thiomicrospira sp. R3 TaxID=3035472 RepID=UPI00259B1EC4|nr:penicillin-binding protein 1A [Thiomicrospira sp. R3]WFE69384.1 penicillin-binding protein 1A [Thiomicrospira sp. R3]
MESDDFISSVHRTKKQQEPKKNQKTRKWLKYSLWILVSSIFLPIIALSIYVINVYPTLPDASELKNISYQVPLRIETADGRLITEIGEKRRIPLEYHQIPERMTQAIISAEDDRFYEHWGIDLKGLARAVYELISTGSKQSGGSTITMQVARNFFLTNERTYTRKLNEIILAFKIEHELSKQEIMALYLNKIFLGHRSYGVAAAAKTYYGKELNELELHEFAMIAGLPKAPSAFNPVANPPRAQLRREYVLRRMHELGYISRVEMRMAQEQPVEVSLSGVRIDVEAGYIAEMARQFALENFGEDALNLGLTIVTTLQSQHQLSANQALRDGLQDYERRQGYRGPVSQLDHAIMTNEQSIIQAMREFSSPGGLQLATVTDIRDNQANLLLRNGERSIMRFEGMNWAAPFININRTGPAPQKMDDILSVGDVIYLQRQNSTWQLAQNPQADGAIVGLNPRDGSIYALAGGFDFFKSRFNRATQAKRQLGSAFKPILYSAALERDYTLATVVNDAPVVFHDDALEGIWRPENFTGRFYGPTRVRPALAHSKNLVPIRILQDIGIHPTVNHAAAFGLAQAELQKHRNLSLALGSVEVTPLEAARAFAVFANGGYLIEPYFVRQVRDFNGRTIYQADPLHACQIQCLENDPSLAPRVISPQNAYLITSMLQDVISYGTGRSASSLNRKDLAGKTGTTNQQFDAWFVGYNPDVVTSVWVGFDNPSSLGRRETAGRAALPIWIDYMRTAIQSSPNIPFLQPEGLVNVPIDPDTGLAVPADTANAVFELFLERNAPEPPSITPSTLRNLTIELFQ